MVARRILTMIARSQAAIAEGESYEVCLTNQLSAQGRDRRHGRFTKRLRRHNPVPYAAWLRLDDLHVLSSSPESFLRVSAEGHGDRQADQGYQRTRRVSARKTARRARGLAQTAKRSRRKT